jgi:hypothetical protein
VWHVGWDVQHFTRANHDFLLLVGADPEVQRTLEHVGDLLVLM